MNIPDEAVEAAARAVYEDNYRAISAGTRWGESDYRDIQDIYRNEARIALEAAASFFKEEA